MAPLTLKIDGMSCGHCVASVQKALDGVAGVQVDSVRIGQADLSYDPARTTAEDVVAAIREAGYAAKPSGGNRT